MPIHSAIKDSIRETQEYLKQYDIQIPYASQRAVNDTAFRVRTRFAERGPQVLDRPKPWIYKAWRVEKAKDRKRIRASILIKDPERQAYWNTAITGGEGVLRALTVRLHREGKLPRNYRLIAGNIKTDSFGNISLANWKRVEAKLANNQAFAGKLNGRNAWGVFERMKGPGNKIRTILIGVVAKSARSGIFSLQKEAGNIGEDYRNLFTEHHAANLRKSKEKIRERLRKR